MTDYKNIRGKKVKFLTSDLSNEQAEGQIFYSDTDNDFKTVVASAAWSSSANMLTARGLGGGAGTPTSAFVASGYTTTIVANTEEYNGTGFSSGANVGTARSQTAGAGTETAGLIAGGFAPPSVGNAEEYNGTSWSEQNDMNVERRTMSGTAGTQTAALFFGGYRDITPTPNGAMNSTESYNGTSFTNEPALNTAVWQNTGSGIQTAAVSVGGPPTQTEHYDGSSWTTNAAINTAKIAAGAAGTTSNIVVFGGTTDGGDTGLTGTTELYDGTSWSEVADMAVARRGLGKAGTYNNAIAMGGLGPAKSNTEEFNVSTSITTAAAWASGGNLPAVNNGLAGCGIQTAALGFGSRTPGQDQATYEYDGSSWTSGGSLGTPIGNGNGAGTQTAGLSFGGGPSGGTSTDSREYNGSSWTAGNSMNNAKALAAGTGTQTAALVSHGTPHPNTVSEEYNGTSWTSGGTVGTARYNVGAGGTSSAAVAFGGYPPSTYNAASEDYDGSSWTAGNSLSNKRGLYNGGDGANTNYVYATGGDASGAPLGSDTNAVEIYNGTNWATAPNLTNGRRSGASGAGGTSSLSIFFGGRTGGSDQNKTEEFTGETTALNLKTITDS